MLIVWGVLRAPPGQLSFWLNHPIGTQCSEAKEPEDADLRRLAGSAVWRVPSLGADALRCEMPQEGGLHLWPQHLVRQPPLGLRFRWFSLV